MTAAALATIDQLEARADVLTTFFMHICECPPHGPFAHLTALTLQTVLAQRHHVHISPGVAEVWIRKYFNVDHLRDWPSFYVPSDIALDVVESL